MRKWTKACITENTKLRHRRSRRPEGARWISRGMIHSVCLVSNSDRSDLRRLRALREKTIPLSVWATPNPRNVDGHKKLRRLKIAGLEAGRFFLSLMWAFSIGVAGCSSGFVTLSVNEWWSDWLFPGRSRRT